MAISKLEVGVVPLGVGGDSLRSAAAKINANFSGVDGELTRLTSGHNTNSTKIDDLQLLTNGFNSKFNDQSNAASRKVGREVGNVSEYMAYGIGNTGWGGTAIAPLSGSLDINNPPTIRNGAYAIESYYFNGSYGGNLPIQNHGVFVNLSVNESTSSMEGVQLFIQRLSNKATPAFYYRTFDHVSAGAWVKVYTDANTTKDLATGFLKASSPVLHVYNDSITKIHEAEQLDIIVDKKGVGHYEIHGTTGLRKDDGWFMSPPRDVHANVLCMVDLEEKDGVIILKTYKKLFDFESVSIVHDYDNPMDIPEGVCVEFRFNDLPIENLDDTNVEV